MDSYVEAHGVFICRDARVSATAGNEGGSPARGLPLLVLDLGGALAAHPVEVITRAAVLHPLMTGVGAVA